MKIIKTNDDITIVRHIDLTLVNDKKEEKEIKVVVMEEDDGACGYDYDETYYYDNKEIAIEGFCEDFFGEEVDFDDIHDEINDLLK